MISLRAVLTCVRSAPFEAITANETWDFKITQGIYLLLSCSWYYRSTGMWQLYPSNFPPHKGLKKGICGKGDSTIDKVSLEYCPKYFVAFSFISIFHNVNWCKGNSVLLLYSIFL